MAEGRGLIEWRRMPPAVFPPMLGAIGLGLVLMRGGPVLGLSVSIGWYIFIFFTAVYAVFLTSYAGKVLMRAGALLEDLRSPPGRLGVAAMIICAMLIASGLVKAAPWVAEFTLFASLIAHLMIALLVLGILIGGPRAGWQVTPAWHLVFVGFIVGSQAAALLGFAQLAVTILGATFLVALAIYGASFEVGRRAPLPPPMRPTLAIHLAPLSLFGTTSVMLGLGVLAQLFAIFASIVAILLLARLRWIIETGFSPAWSAFTFPPVAYAGLLLMLAEIAEPYRWVGGACWASP